MAIYSPEEDIKISVKTTPEQGSFSVAKPEQGTVNVAQSGNNLTVSNPNVFTPITKPATKPVASISTSQAISNVNQDKARLDQITPQVASQASIDFKSAPTGEYTVAHRASNGETIYLKPGATAPLEYKKVEGPSGTVSYTNEQGQEAEFTSDQLQNQSIQDFLKSGGYVMTKASGTAPDATQTDLEKSVAGYNKQMEDLVSSFNSLNVDQDPEYQAIVNSIKQKYARMTEEMKKTNAQREAAFKSLGYRTGTTQYAGGVQLGIEGEELNQANQRLADIASAEATALSAARTAFQTGKWEQFGKQMEMLDKLRANKQEELSNYNQKLAAADAKLQQERAFQFEVMKYMDEKAAAAAEKAKPITLSPGQTIYDPNTNEAIYTAPERPSDNKPITEKVGDTLLQWNPNTGGWDSILVGGYNQGFSDDAMNWATAISNGQAKLSDITGDPTLKTQVISAMQKLPPSTKAVEDAQTMIEKLKELYNPETKEQHRGMDSAVGPAFTGALSRTWLSEPFTGNRTAFLGLVNEIVSKRALDELIASKKEGATFGALSDREMDILKAASTQLGNWEIRDKDGRVTGYKTTEANVRSAIEKMITDYQNLINEAGGIQTDPLSKLKEYGNKNPGAREFISNAMNPATKNPTTGKPWTEQEIMEVLGIPFNKVGGDTNQAVIKKVSSIPNSSYGGQCGRFVNKLTGLGLGDSYQNKMSKMNPNIVKPQPGMVFVMPYKNTGHTGIILAVNPDGTATVKDSNWSLDEKVKTHKIPVSQMTGFQYA